MVKRKMRKISAIMEKIGLVAGDEIKTFNYDFNNGTKYWLDSNGYLHDVGGNIDIITTADVLFDGIPYQLQVKQITSEDYCLLKLLSAEFKSIVYHNGKIFVSRLDKNVINKMLEKDGVKLFETADNIMKKTVILYIIPYISEDSALESELNENSVYSIKFLLKRYKQRVRG